MTAEASRVNEEWPAVADILPAWPDDEVGEDKANNGGGIGNQDEDWPAVADVLPTWPEDCEMWEGKSGAGMDFTSSQSASQTSWQPLLPVCSKRRT